MRAPPSLPTLAVLVASAALAIGPAEAGLAHAPSETVSATSWTLSPLLTIGLLLVVALYVTDAIRIARRRRSAAQAGRNRCFVLAIGLLVVALVSPFDALADDSFVVHMGQHLVLVFAVAPLVVISRADRAILRALTSLTRGRGRRQLSRAWTNVGRALTRPAVAWPAFVLTFWLWHVPALYDLALRHDIVHGLEHATMLVAAIAFWHPVLSGTRQRLPAIAGVGYVLSMALQGGVLGSLLLFSRVSWYPGYQTDALGISPLESQQAGGALMNIVCTFVAIAVVAAIFIKWMNTDQGQPARASTVVPARRPRTALSSEVHSE